MLIPSSYLLGRWHVEIQKLEKLLEQHPSAKLVVINFPHNPTGELSVFFWLLSHFLGVSIKDEELEEIVQLCRKYGCFLFSDEMYYNLGNPQTKSAVELYVHV
jgi:aspartate/methionine/tyrosine aminotransferase